MNSDYYIVSQEDLMSIADAIREKSGIDADLVLPSGFVSAVEAILSGEDAELFVDYVEGVQNLEFLNATITTISSGALRRSISFSANFPNVTTIGADAFRDSKISNGFWPKVTNVGNSAFRSSSLIYAIFPALTVMGTSMLESVGNPLLGADFGATAASTCSINNWTFYNDTNCSLIILRYSSVAPLLDVRAFQGSAFASGKSGGTIYIPKALYDHLGDGTSLDYKAATNWSTVDGYGTITWAQIEGSIYETQYVDGTPISSQGGAT